MEQDNVKWKYNADKHEVVEQATMKEPICLSSDGHLPYWALEEEKEYEKHLASLRSILVSGKVDWIDGQEVEEGKDFTIEMDAHPDWVPSYNNPDDPPTVIFVVPIIKQEQPQQVTDDKTLKEIGKQVKKDVDDWLTYRELRNRNQSQEQDNVTGGAWVKELIDIRNKLYNDLPTGENKDWELLQMIKWHINDLDNYATRLNNFISSLQSRLQSLEASNNFHKQQAEEAIAEQWRLIKALEQIEQMSDPGSYENAIINMKQIATKALKP